MALVEKYNISFQDIHFGNQWLIEIFQEGWSGGITDLIAGPDPIRLKIESEDDIFFPIKSTYCELDLVATASNQYVEFFNCNRLDYKVIVKKNTQPQFEGFIVIDDYTEPTDSPPFIITVRFSDGLALLKNITYQPGDITPSDNMITPLQVFYYGLGLTGLELTLNDSCDIFNDNMDIGNQYSPWNQIRIYFKGFEGDNYYNIISKLLFRFVCEIRQSQGGWHIRRLTQLTGDHVVRVFNYGVSSYSYSSNASENRVEQTTLPSVLKTTINSILKGGTWRLDSPIKKLKIKSEFSTINNLLWFNSNPSLGYVYTYLATGPDLPSPWTKTGTPDIFAYYGKIICHTVATPSTSNYYSQNFAYNFDADGGSKLIIEIKFSFYNVSSPPNFQGMMLKMDNYYLYEDGTWSTTAHDMSIQWQSVSSQSYYVDSNTIRIVTDSFPSFSSAVPNTVGEFRLYDLEGSTTDQAIQFNDISISALTGTEIKTLNIDVTTGFDSNNIKEKEYVFNLDDGNYNGIIIKNAHLHYSSQMFYGTSETVMETWDIQGESETDTLNELVAEEIAIQKRLPRMFLSAPVISNMINFLSIIQAKEYQFKYFLILRGAYHIKSGMYQLDLYELSDGTEIAQRITEGNDTRITESSDNRII